MLYRQQAKDALVLMAGIAIIVSLVVLCGCAAHRTVPAGTTATPITPLEQANSDSAQISAHNRAAAKTLVAAFQAGVIEKSYFDTASAFQVKITRLKKQLNPLLSDTVTASTNSAKVRSILGQISAAATSIVQSGSTGIKNSQTQTALITDAQAIISLSNSIISTLATAGIVK